MDSFLVGILSGIGATVLLRLGIFSYQKARAWHSFRPFHKIWSPFTKGPTFIILTGKKQGHTIKVSANERDAAELIKKTLFVCKEPEILIANGDYVNLQDKNIVAFGSERDNEVTRSLLASISSFLNYEYTADNNLVVNGELFGSKYRDNVLIKDYALVCKAANPYSPKHKFLVFSGNHGIGTQGAVFAFTSRDPMRSILEKVGANDFYAVIETEIDKRFGIKPTQVNVVRCGFIGAASESSFSTKAASREEKLQAFIKDLGGDDKYLEHVQQRARFALEITRSMEARGFDLDADAIYFGAMLHDIGRTLTQDIDHGLKGGELVLSHKDRLRNDFAIMPDTLSKIVESIECHIVGGLKCEWIEKANLPIPPRDYVPHSIEAKIVVFSDQILHGWDKQDSVLREAPELDSYVYRQFYGLTRSIFEAAYLQGQQ